MQVTFYKNCKIQPNHYIQNLSDYLSNLNDYSTNLTTSKAFSSDEDSFSIRISVSDLSDLSNWNYAEIANDNIIRYYFVTGFRYISESIYEFDLALDIPNTYQTDIMKNDNFRQVKINRRHKNRWKIGSDSNYYRIYDKVDEGLGDVATEVETKDLIQSNDNNAYIITRQVKDSAFLRIAEPMIVNQIVFDEVENKRVLNYTASDITCSDATSGHKKGILIYSNTPDNLISCYLDAYGKKGYNCLFNCAYLFQYLTSSDGLHTYIMLGHCTQNDGRLIFTNEIDLGKTDYDVKLKASGFTGLDNFSIYYTTNNGYEAGLSVGYEYEVTNIIKNYSTALASADLNIHNILSIENLVRTDDTILQISVLPYQPSNTIYYLNYLGLHLVKDSILTKKGTYLLTNNYKTTITKSVQERDKTYESKLYGSYVRNHLIAYDTFSLAVQPEDYNGDIKNLSYELIKPADLSSNLGLIVDNIKEKSLNSNKLVFSKNLNAMLYTSSYLEYARNGYNYDLKSKSLQNIKNAIGIGGNVLSTGLNLAKGGSALGPFAAIQSGVNVATGFFNMAITDLENERALEQKKTSSLNSSISINGSDDYLIYSKMNGGNKFDYVVTKPNEDIETNIWNLFYYTGYADNLYYNELPTIKSRVYFNYLEADIGYVNLDDRKEITRLKDAFKSGITFEWNYNDTWLMEGNLYENWETTY